MLYSNISFKDKYGSELTLKLSSDQKLLNIESSVILKPGNRKQKKYWKRKAYKFKSTGNGYYKVTQNCSVNLKIFTTLLSKMTVKNDTLGFELNK